jgi:MFS transporter, DHA1 family, multidrug resistance protein
MAVSKRVFHYLSWMSPMNNKTFPIALALGAICALGPFATDMHVSALPLMATDLATSDSVVQMSMMTYFVGYMIGQLFYGPISDRTGRKPVIYVALVIFALASLGCAFAADGTQMLVFRFLQGVGGSIGMVIATAAIRDLYTGEAAAKLMGMVMMVFGLAPVIAPLIGNMMLHIGDWRMIFLLLAVISVAVGAIIFLLMPETRLQEIRAQNKPSAALHWYGRLLFTRSFIPYAMTMAFAQGGFFAYIAGSSFVLMNVYGLSATTYSLIFSLNAVGVGIGAQLSALLSRRLGLEGSVKASTLIYAMAGLALFASVALKFDSLVLVCSLLFLLVTALGSTMPTCNILAMRAHGAISGTAAALMGALGFAAGAFGSFLIGVFADGSARPLMLVIAGFSVASALAAGLWFPARPRHASDAKAA